MRPGATQHSAAFRKSVYTPHVLRWRLALLVALVALTGPACLVVSLQPAYDDDSSLTWDPTLVGIMEKR